MRGCRSRAPGSPTKQGLCYSYFLLCLQTKVLVPIGPRMEQDNLKVQDPLKIPRKAQRAALGSKRLPNKLSKHRTFLSTVFIFPKSDTWVSGLLKNHLDEQPFLASCALHDIHTCMCMTVGRLPQRRLRYPTGLT